ncbi:MAG: VTT domain-containing protein [Bacteroidales bacterium]|nr:VTT domain-containing protein [Bacteroidales bacterium]
MEKKGFLWRNIGKGILWLAAIVFGYVLIKRYVNIDYFSWLEPVFDNHVLIMLIFTVSEILIGIIPPEFFVIWALRFETLHNYIIVVFILSFISYLAGIIAYFTGKYFSSTQLYRYLWKKKLRKFEQNLQQFGAVLIIIASLTPVPFSGVAMLMGSVNFKIKHYLSYSLIRFVRFAIIGFIIWETKVLT